jgi:hypothetical protein
MPTAPPPDSFSRQRRFKISVSVLVSVFSALALAAMVNYLAVRYHTRFRWLPAGSLELSPATTRMLKSLTNDVKVVVYWTKDDLQLYHSVSSLLDEYHLLNPKRVTVEYVDYKRQPAAADRVISDYKLPTGTDYNVVIFDANGRPPRLVYQRELSEYDYQALLQRSNEVRRTAFKGELLFTSAIISVTEPRPLKAYFVSGHAEHDPGSDSTYGYSTLARLLQQQHIFTAGLFLGGTNPVPSDCDLLIIGGPESSYSDNELEKVNQFLERGGRALICFRQRYDELYKSPGLERVLARWGVQVGNNWVVDYPNSVQKGEDLISTNFTGHPAVRGLAGTQVRLGIPRSVEPASGKVTSADAPKVERLMLTGDQGEVRTNRHQSSIERRGPIAVAVAVEKGGLQGLRAAPGSTRLIVVGESLFLANVLIDDYKNRDFATLAVNWLVDRPQLQGGIGPRPLTEYTLTMTASQMERTRWFLLGIIPGSILLLGVLVWWRRRR